MPAAPPRPAPTRFGRQRYRTAIVARPSAEDLAPFRAPENAAHDVTQGHSGRSAEYAAPTDLSACPVSPPVASGGPGTGPAYSNLQSSPCGAADRPASFRNPAGTCAMRRRGRTCGSRPLQTPADLRSRIRLPPGREPGADAVLRRAAAAGRLDPARLGRQLEPAGAAGPVVLQAPAQDILPARAGEAEADLRD